VGKKSAKKTAKKESEKKKREEATAEEGAPATPAGGSEAVAEPAPDASAEEPSVKVEPEQEIEDEKPEKAEKKEEEPKPRTVKRIVPPRKGLAKVIKKAAIQIPEETHKAPARRPPRPAKGKGKVAVVAQAPAIKAGEAKGGEDARGGKGKKKGKRLVQFRSGADDPAGRLKKPFGSKRKGRKGFGNDRDYEFGSRVCRGPKGKKKQSEPMQPQLPRPRLLSCGSRFLRRSALVTWPTGCR